MNPHDPAPADVPPPPPPLLDASEEEDLLRHLRRYQPRDTSRRPTRTLVAAATVVAGAGLLLGVVMAWYQYRVYVHWREAVRGKRDDQMRG